MPMAQAMELKSRWERAQVHHDLRPGMLCVEKQGIGVFPDVPVLILWRLLDSADWFDRQIMKDYIGKEYMSRIDCIIGRLDEEAVRLYFIPHALELLEPYTEGDNSAHLRRKSAR